LSLVRLPENIKMIFCAGKIYHASIIANSGDFQTEISATNLSLCSISALRVEKVNGGVE
jgi:hypothetical protein